MGTRYLNRCQDCGGTGICKYCKDQRREALERSRRQDRQRDQMGVTMPWKPYIPGLFSLGIVRCGRCNSTGTCFVCEGRGGSNLVDD